MIYNEQKLASLSRTAFKYETKKIINTHHAIREAIAEHYDGNSINEKYGLGSVPVLDVYLQGSYKNSTNVTQSSDVDLVVQLTSIWRANKESLTPEQLEKYNSSYTSVSYPFSQFNIDIFHALQAFFGEQCLTNRHKCLKLTEHDNFCDADIIPCYTYREYGYFKSVDHQQFEEGMYFLTNDGEMVRNFPKQHYKALVAKSENTNGIFKETIRMFKNIKDDLIEKEVINDGIVKSYFIENMLYNMPDKYFAGTYEGRFRAVLEYLITQFNEGQFPQFKCANGIDLLCTESNWHIENVHQFLVALTKVRDENEL